VLAKLRLRLYCSSAMFFWMRISYAVLASPMGICNN